MIKDPLTVWDGPFPYDELAGAGVTPESPHAQVVDDAPFTLMTAGMLNPRTQKALDELKDPVQRLVVDFLLYDVDLDAEFATARAHLREPPAEPAAVTEALLVSTDALREQADEIASAAPVPAVDVPERPRADAFPALALIDELIRFDR